MNYNQAITLNAQHANAYYNKGYSLFSLGKVSEAVECYNQAISLDPNYAGNTYYSKGKALFFLRNNNIDMSPNYNQVNKLPPLKSHLPSLTTKEKVHTKKVSKINKAYDLVEPAPDIQKHISPTPMREIESNIKTNSSLELLSMRTAVNTLATLKLEYDENKWLDSTKKYNIS